MHVPAHDLELRPTIDRIWLEEAVRTDPLSHAYALWDLLHLPRSVRFVSALEHGRTVGYLLIWLGRPAAPVVHWAGGTTGAALLARRLPIPPFVAIVPPEVEADVRAVHPDARASPILLMWRGRGPPGTTDPEGLVRRLGRSDRETLKHWSLARPGTEHREYLGVDPAEEPVWGAFESGRLVGVVRASVRLPMVWVVSGVYVDPEVRGHGLGRRLVGALVEEAERAHAPTGLFVREESAAARHVYLSLGYRPVGRRLWMDVAGGGGTPQPPAPEGVDPP